MGDKTQIELIKEYAPIVMYSPMAGVMFTTNKLSLTKMAVYAASLNCAKHDYISWRVLKKPFFQALWESYGRGF